MKSVVFAFLIALLLLAGCGRNGITEDPPETPPPLIVPTLPTPPALPDDQPPVDEQDEPGNTVLHVPEVTLRVAEERPGLEGIPILWGYNSLLFRSNDIIQYDPETNTLSTYTISTHVGNAPGDNAATAAVKRIQSALSEQFNVRMEGVDTAIADMDASDSLRPDIFMLTVYSAQGLVRNRTIPEDMLRRYAPNYAALLDIYDGWEISRAPNGEQFALNTFNVYEYDLGAFSVYRLEWLEEMGIELPGPVTEMATGVYFSHDAYTHNEFALIMDAFTRNERNPITRVPIFWQMDNSVSEADSKIWGMEVPRIGDTFQSLAPVWGMFGVNNSIMEEDGQLLPFFATQAYRAALIFLEDMAARGSVFINNWSIPYVGFTCPYVRVGWASVRTRDLYNVILQASGQDPDRRFLITPPENGGPRRQGIGQSAHSFNPEGHAWAIGSHVTDDTLSRILNIFDELSFNPQWTVVSHYGFHRESFRWSGEPYHSRVVHNADTPMLFDNLPRNVGIREGAFATGILDGHAWRQAYLGEFEEVRQFAQSTGREMILRPAREDFGLDDGFPEFNWMVSGWGLGRWGLAHQFLMDVLEGNIRVASSWDDYIEDLYANGLQAIIGN